MAAAALARAGCRDGKFKEQYHVRSNVESANGSFKVTQLQKLRCRSFGGQENEALAILVACNLRILSRKVRMRRLELDLYAEVLAFEDSIREIVEMRRCESLVQVA